MRWTSASITAGVAALILAGCGSTAQTAAQQASSLLAKTGAASSGFAYMAGPGDPGAECSTGAAEADGTIGSAEDVYVCVFPSAADLARYVTSGGYEAGAALIQAGQAALVIVTDAATLQEASPPSSLVQSIARKTGGTVYSS